MQSTKENIQVHNSLSSAFYMEEENCVRKEGTTIAVGSEYQDLVRKSQVTIIMLEK